MKIGKMAFATLAALVFVALMGFVERTLAPAYWLKSLMKASAILLILGLYAAAYQASWREATYFRKMKPAKALYLLIAATLAVLVLTFLLTRNYLDLSSIRRNLTAKERLKKENCLFVFAYIAMVNSFLEEAFFRGFLYHAFAERGGKAAALAFSSCAFAAYHIGIVDGWLNPGLLTLCIAGLTVAGVFLQLVCERYGSVKASWLVHGCANLAIDALGVVLIFFY